MTLRKSSGGFTLIELMTVIVIVAVLLAVGLPAYQDQVIRGHRSAAKAEMLEIANRQQQFLLSNRSYTSDHDATTIGDLSYTLPPDVAARYTFELATVSVSGVPAFQLEFNAQGAQVSDGDLTLDSEGTKGPPGEEEKWKR